MTRQWHASYVKENEESEGMAKIVAYGNQLKKKRKRDRNKAAYKAASKENGVINGGGSWHHRKPGENQNNRMWRNNHQI